MYVFKTFQITSTIIIGKLSFIWIKVLYTSRFNFGIKLREHKSKRNDVQRYKNLLSSIFTAQQKVLKYIWSMDHNKIRPLA
jgi:hypothetical protein